MCRELGKGDRERVTGLRRKPITHPSVPAMSRCSPPSALLGGEGPLLPLPRRHTPERTEFTGFLCTWGRLEWPCASLAGASLALSLARHSCTVSSALVQGLGTPLGDPLMGHDTPCAVDELSPRRRAPQLSCSAQQRMGGHCLSVEVFQHTPKASLPPHFGVRVCVKPGSWEPWGCGVHPKGV